MFDSHPVLQVTFDIDASVPLKNIWSLPRGIDDFAVDADRADEQAISSCGKRCHKFYEALRHQQANEALRQFALCFEDTFAEACIGEDKCAIKLPEACRKKCRNKL